jgi:hypothetical protein
VNGLDVFVKLALEQGRRERALSALDTARPYAQKGLAGGITGLWTGMNINKLRRPPPRASRTVRVPRVTGVRGPRKGLPIALAALGALLGMGDEQLHRLARQAKYRSILKETRREA